MIALRSQPYSFDFVDYKNFHPFRKLPSPTFFFFLLLRLYGGRFLSLPTKTILINTEIIAAFQVEKVDLSYGSGGRDRFERNLVDRIIRACILFKFRLQERINL